MSLITQGKISWAELELSHSAGASLPLSPGALTGLTLYRLRLSEWDARRAEATLMISQRELTSAEWEQPLRTHLFRGRLQEAKNLITQVELNQSNPISNSELELEKARLSAFERNWSECLLNAGRALGLEPSAITRLSLFQIQALARFEMGDFGRALEDLSRAESLMPMFPEAAPKFYAQLVRIKIEARLTSAREGLSQLAKLWASITQPTLDELLSLLRAEIDLRRLAGLPHSSHAEASYLLADLIGDRLYTSYASLDRAYACGKRKALREIDREFVGVSRLAESVEARKGIDTTSETICKFLLSEVSETAPVSGSRGILVLPYGIFVSLESRNVETRKITDRDVRILELLSQGPVSKKQFFESVWLNHRYSSHLHDGVIRTAISRVRKTAGVSILIEDQKIHLETLGVICR